MKRIVASLAALSLFALTACQQSSNTIKLGVIAPLTGDVAGLGADTTNGVKMAIEEINAKGGVGGKMIELVAEDGKCNGADAGAAAQKLVNVDKVIAIIGGDCSGETLAAAPITEAAKVVLLSPTSSSPDVTKAGDFVFRNYPSDALKTVAMAKLMKDKGWKKLAMISENTDFSQGFRKSLLEKLPKNQVVFDETVEPGTKDFRTLLTRLKSLEFDVFFPNGNSDAVIGPMLQQLREAWFTQKALDDAGDSVTMAENLKEVTEGFMVINVPSTLTDDGSFQKNFETKYGKAQYGISFAGYAYDNVKLLADLMGKGAMDGTALKDALYALTSYKGVVGTFHFDKNGDVIGIPYVLKKFHDGKIETLEPINVQ